MVVAARISRYRERFGVWRDDIMARGGMAWRAGAASANRWKMKNRCDEASVVKQTNVARKNRVYRRVAWRRRAQRAPLSCRRNLINSI